MAEHKAPTDRLNYTGDLTPIVQGACVAYGLGILQNFSVIEVGYEDCNVIIEADEGKFLAKMFAKFRTPEDIQRYVTTIGKALEAGVRHPALVSTKNGEATYKSHDVTMALLEFVEGKTFYDLGRAPDSSERTAIIKQAAKIHQINYKPDYLFDPWAIPNIRSMYDRVKQHISSEDMSLVKEAISRYEAIPIADLPHAFVHGDMIKTNMLKGDDGKVYVLDFSVANWYPRIQELAVIVSSLLPEEGSLSIVERCEIAAREYGRFNPLTELEKKSLPAYALAGAAMEFMGAHQEKYINGVESEENEHWLRVGREGLRGALMS